MAYHKDYWTHDEDRAIAFLDSIPDNLLLALCNVGDDIRDIIDRIEDKFDTIYNNRYHVDTGIFNSLANSEFEEYLDLRFKIVFQEETKYILTSIGRKS